MSNSRKKRKLRGRTMQKSKSLMIVDDPIDDPVDETIGEKVLRVFGREYVVGARHIVNTMLLAEALAKLSDTPVMPGVLEITPKEEMNGQEAPIHQED